MRNPFMQGDSGLLRRIPVAFHFLIVGALLGMFQVVSPQFRRLLISFNESATLSWETLLIVFVLLVGYAFTLILLASTKILVEWLVDGK